MPGKQSIQSQRPRSLPRLGMVLAGLLLLSACANMKPYQPAPGSEIPPGPGLLSGKNGEFSIFRK